MDGLIRSDAKAFFANERTFLHWLNVSVTIGSISAAMLGVSGHAHHHWGSDYAKHAVASRVVALAMLLTAIFMAVYSSFTFAYRGALLKYKLDMGYDNRILPVVLTCVLSVALASVFIQAWTAFRDAD